MIVSDNVLQLILEHKPLSECLLQGLKDHEECRTHAPRP